MVSWQDITKLKLYKLKSLVLPWRMELVRNDGSVVTSGGVTIPEAAVALFSTAGYGRIPPRNLASLIVKRFGTETPYNQLFYVLSRDRSKFVYGKYQALDS
jgi:hypothetical protein